MSFFIACWFCLLSILGHFCDYAYFRNVFLTTGNYGISKSYNGRNRSFGAKWMLVWGLVPGKGEGGFPYPQHTQRPVFRDGSHWFVAKAICCSGGRAQNSRSLQCHHS